MILVLMCDHLAFIYKCIRLVRHGTLLPPIVTTIQNIILCWFIHNVFIFHKCVSVLTSWMTSEIHSFNSLEVSYVCVKLLLVFWHSNLCTLFILIGFNHLTMVIICPFIGFLDISRNFHSGNYIVWTFITLIYF